MSDRAAVSSTLVGFDNWLRGSVSGAAADMLDAAGVLQRHADSLGAVCI